MIENLLRDTVKIMHKYVPGEPIEAVKEKYGVTEVIKLASNENPLGTSPKAIAAMTEMLKMGNLYPEPEGNELRRKLAKRFGLKPENFATANGADNILTLIGNTFVNPGDEVVYCDPTFGAYNTLAVKQQGVPVALPVTADYKFDLDAMAAHITDKTKLVCMCNPNNPTGTIVDNADLDKFINNLPDHVVAIIDEAYFELITEPNYESAVRFVKEGKNVIVTRTFSKAYGMAGIRIGYAIAREDIIENIFTVREAFATNRIALAGASAALDDDEFLQEVLKVNAEGIKYFTEELTKLGFKVVPTQTNFMLVDMGDVNVGQLFEDMKKKGFVFRAWGFPNGKKYMRVSIGTDYQNKKFVAALKETLNIK